MHYVYFGPALQTHWALKDHTALSQNQGIKQPKHCHKFKISTCNCLHSRKTEAPKIPVCSLSKKDFIVIFLKATGMLEFSSSLLSCISQTMYVLTDTSTDERSVTASKCCESSQCISFQNTCISQCWMDLVWKWLNCSVFQFHMI